MLKQLAIDYIIDKTINFAISPTGKMIGRTIAIDVAKTCTNTMPTQMQRAVHGFTNDLQKIKNATEMR